MKKTRQSSIVIAPVLSVNIPQQVFIRYKRKECYNHGQEKEEEILHKDSAYSNEEEEGAKRLGICPGKVICFTNT
jgi:hypothetical protein